MVPQLSFINKKQSKCQSYRAWLRATVDVRIFQIHFSKLCARPDKSIARYSEFTYYPRDIKT